MRKKIRIFIIALGIAGIWVPISWAVLGRPVPRNSPSLEEFSEGLQGLSESTDRLTRENVQQEKTNDDLKKQVLLFESSLQQMAQYNQQLEKELQGLNEKTKGRDDSLNRMEEESNKSLDVLKKMDQEIALSRIAYAERAKQQKYLLEILALTRKKDPVQLDMKSVLENQEVLKKKASYGDRHVRELENEYKELSFWYGDSSVSLPRLKDVKDQVQGQVDAYQRNGISDQWARSDLEIKNLEKDVKEIVFQHDLYRDMSQALEQQYRQGSLSREVMQEEQKLAINLAHLKRKNKVLQRQASELRLEMVVLDKKKSELE